MPSEICSISLKNVFKVAIVQTNQIDTRSMGAEERGSSAIHPSPSCRQRVMWEEHDSCLS
ncbi:MAG: hypothetical protein ACXVCO_12740, partial [Ktedonobacterales bacterium]